MNWIGSPDQELTVCAARKDAEVQTVMDLFQKPLAIGGAGSGADLTIYPQFLSGLLGMKFDVIKGYTGSHDVALAMERNEVQGVCVVYDSLQLQPLWREGKVNILFQASPKADPRLAGVPIITEFARSDQDRKVLQFFFSRVQLGRPLVAPPDLPPQRVAMLRKAFDRTMNDPELIAAAQKLHLAVEPITGQELAEVIGEIYKAPRDVVEQTLKVLGSASR